MLIRILLEFNCFFNLQNVAKKSNSFQYKLEVGLYSWGGGGGGLKPDALFFLQVGRLLNGGAYKLGGGGVCNQKFMVCMFMYIQQILGS